MSMRMAAKVALNSQFKQHRVGAVLVKGGNILATGFNSRQPSKILGTTTRHAEASAVLKLLKERRLDDLIGSECYVTRFTAGGKCGISKPCPSCHELLRSVGVRNCWYTDVDGQTVKEKIN